MLPLWKNLPRQVKNLADEAEVLLELTRGFITSEMSTKETQPRSLPEELVKKAEPKEEMGSGPPDLDLEDKFEEF
ncbi:hypothetical protein DMNBHIDG_00538 [Candidatus Methanoperedenaceae archaeon GB37]|nr:hypothetical protein DMNBHIDG_00538 [Candidatus Methanoperedenaceae archaeon GB37]